MFGFIALLLRIFGKALSNHLKPFYAQCGFPIFKEGIIHFESMKWDDNGPSAPPKPIPHTNPRLSHLSEFKIDPLTEQGLER